MWGNDASNSMDSAVALLPDLCWRRRYSTVAGRDSVQHSIVAVLLDSKRTKSCRSTNSWSERHSDCFVSESRKCNESCMLRGHGDVLDKARQTCKRFLNKGKSNFSFMRNVEHFVPYFTF